MLIQAIFRQRAVKNEYSKVIKGFRKLWKREATCKLRYNKYAYDRSHKGTTIPDKHGQHFLDADKEIVPARWYRPRPRKVELTFISSCSQMFKKPEILANFRFCNVKTSVNYSVLSYHEWRRESVLHTNAINRSTCALTSLSPFLFRPFPQTGKGANFIARVTAKG